MIEIERKFLVKNTDFEQNAVKKLNIKQGYLSKDPARSVRIRIIDEQGWLTIKGPTDPSGIERYEYEETLSPGQAHNLFALCLPGSIAKTRYLVAVENLVYEVDVFHQDNDGLVLAELELPTRDTPFNKPSWLGEEVTGDIRYYNSYLSDHPFSSW